MNENQSPSGILTLSQQDGKITKQLQIGIEELHTNQPQFIQHIFYY